MKITLGLSLSLSGAFAPIGRQIQDALRLFVADANAAGGVTIDGQRATYALRCHDDRSDRTRCAGIYRELCGGTGTDIVLGPYSSELTAVAAPIAEENRRLFMNHAGAADSLYTRGYKMIVGVQTPASQYLNEFIRLVASLKFWRKKLAMITEPTAFASAISSGAEALMRNRSVRRKGVRLRVKWDEKFDPAMLTEKLLATLRRNRINAVVSAGTYDHDVGVMRAILRSDLNIPVLACVAAGLSRFRTDLGDGVEGIVGASQWEPSSQAIPELGPDPREFTHRMRTQTRAGECDYIAAQAYAAGVLVAAVLDKLGTCDQVRMREYFSTLRTGTLFGAFGIDPETGRQVAHRMLTIQWHNGRKVTIDSPSLGDMRPSEPALGRRLFMAGAEMIGLSRRGKKSGTNGFEVDQD